MQRPKVKAADFVGREAYVAQRDGARPVGALHAGRRRPHVGERGEALHARRRADPERDGEPLTDGHGHHPYVTTAGSAPSLGKHLLLAYLPPAEASIGNQLTVSYMEELYPVTVGSVDATALLDPANERIR